MWPFTQSVFEKKVLNQLEKIMASLAELEAQVQANTELETSAIVLIEGIAAKLEEAKTDPVKIQALADELKASAVNLSAAISANTPTVAPVEPVETPAE